ncbi:hypothetical protein [Sphingomonas sp. URHD0057]|uniref:hypothetical protein n=1 Tax=Sphingomonas sp. URHD0057 TaxID=1380389 RepID=UPI00048F59D0|nr:hypothetical protein [Sphingomonas sp. URHD0057]
MNIYRQRFTAPCCNNGLVVIYKLKIETADTIMVEDIQAACVEAAGLPKPYHENIADFLSDRFGGRQRIRAHHHGTDIETRRGE